MTTMRTLWWSLPSVALLAGCLIPERNNPHDPQQSPAARLKIVDVTEAGAACPPADLLDVQWPEAAAVSRGHCLALDARGSSDPQDDALTYLFEVLDSAGNPVTEIFAVNGAPGIAVVPGAVLRAEPLLVAVTFRATVTDGGARSSALASVTLLDSAPIAAVDPPRVIPLGGLPWEPAGTAVDVLFDGSRSTDPDGDPDLTYCWTFPPDGLPTPDAFCGPEAVVSRTLPTSSPSRLVGTMLVRDDAGAESVIVPIEVAVRAPDAWIYPGDYSTDPLARLDQVHRYGILLSYGIRPAYLPRTGGDRVITGTYTGEPENLAILRVVDWPEAVDGGGPTFSLPSGFPGVALGADPERGEVWVYRHAFSGTSARIVVLGLDPAETGLVDLGGSDVPDPYPLDLGSIQGKIRPAGDGVGAWVVRTDHNFLAYANRNGAAAAVAPAAVGRRYSDLDVRPGSDEAWVLDEPDLAAASPDPAPARILRFHAGNANPSDTWETGHDFARDLVWADADHLWVGLPGGELRLLDVGILEEGPGDELSFEAATDFAIVLPVDPSEVFVDADAGGLWAASVAEQTVYLSRGGGVASYPAGAYILFVESQGALVFEETVAPYQVARALAPSRDGRAITVPRGPARPQGFPDVAGGGVWELLSSEGILNRRASDGSLVKRITRFYPPGSDPAVDPPGYLPTTSLVRVSPEGRHLWTIETDGQYGPATGLFRYDLAPEVPVADPLPLLGPADSAKLALGGLLTGEVVFEVSSPATPQSFAWAIPQVAPFPSQSYSVVVIGTDGSMTERLPLPPAETDVSASRSMRTNRLCLATIEGAQAGPSRLRVRWVEPQGLPATVLLADSAGLPQYTYLGVVGTSRDDGDGELCWAVYGTTGDPGETHYRAWDADGILQRSFDEVTGTGTGIGFASSGYASSSRDVWTVMFDPVTFGYAIRRVSFESSGVTAEQYLDVRSSFAIP